MFQSKKVLILVLLAAMLFLVSPVRAAYGLEETAGAAGLQDATPVATMLGNVIGTALSLVAVIFFALMIYGGFMWMTAHGNEEYTKKALDTIIAAIIGIIIILAAYAITNFVFNSVGVGGPPVK